MPAPKNLVNQRFGRLVALRPVGIDKFSNRLWLCRCDCGTMYTTAARRLTSEVCRSCGCLNTETRARLIGERSTTHGQTIGGPSLTYRTWVSVRCRPRRPKYAGITICDRWTSFENFLADMGERPGREYTIDRIDNDKGYEPGNCRWATQKTQQNNRRNNYRLSYNGQSKTLTEWAEATGIAAQTIRKRIDLLGWSIEAALTIPTNKRFRPRSST